MNDLIWDVRDIQNKIADENLMKILWEITPIYSTSDFYHEIISLCSSHRDMTAAGLGCFRYKNHVHFQFLPRNKTEHAAFIYDCCRQTGHLADYRFAAVANRYANSFYLIFLPAGESFDRISELPPPADLDRSHRDSLFRTLAEAAELGVFIPLHSISYNRTTGGFALYDYSRVTVDRKGTAEQKREYLDLQKKLLFL